MRSKTKILILSFLMVTSFTFSQSSTEKAKRRTSNRVEKVEKKVADTNKEIDSTVASIDNTIEGTKQTAKKVGEILFGKKNKKKTQKNVIVIAIMSTSYDNESANQLYLEISKSKTSKDLVKTYSNGQMTIKLESKSSADAIWQKVSDVTRRNFNIEQISERSITLNLKK